MEYHLHQDIAQFFHHAVGIFIVHRFQEFITLFNQVGTNRIKILLPVPGASARFTQYLHHIRQGANVKLCFVLQQRETFPIPACVTVIFRALQHRLQSLLRLAGNKHAGQMVDDRLPVHFKERYLTALFIFQSQIAEEIHFSLIRQDIHQGQLHIRSHHLVINLGYHQRVLSCIRQSRKILCVNDPQPVNRVDSQINISQIQKTHSRFNG